jgi:hypothetical protein
MTENSFENTIVVKAKYRYPRQRREYHHPPGKALLTCSKAMVMYLLDCSEDFIDEKEKEGLLIPLTFWRDRVLSKTCCRWARDNILDPGGADDYKDYPLDHVLALMPPRTEMMGHLLRLTEQYRYLKAGKVTKGFFGPYVAVKLSRTGKWLK